MTDTFPRQVKYDLHTDPNNPLITLVLYPSQVLPLVELVKIMDRKWDYEDDPVGAARQADRALGLIRTITDRNTGIAAQLPDDLWEL